MGVRMEGSLPYMGMVMVILVQVTTMMATKVAMSKGLTNLTIAFYSNSISSLTLLPFAFFFPRSDHLPPLNFSILKRVFLLAFVGFVTQMCGYGGLKYSSPVLGSAMLNLIPAFTFILTLLFRMEKLGWRNPSGKAKLVGTLVCVGGAFVVTFYKGPTISIFPSFPNYSPKQLLLLLPQPHYWTLGGFFFALEALGISFFYILQASILKKYPREITIVFYLSLFVAIQSAAAMLIVERGHPTNSWRIRCDMGLFAVLYTAVIGSSFRVSLVSWCIRKKGALFVSMFKPLGIVIAVLLGVIFAGDVFHLGSLVGAIVIVVGFYGVMWGKAKEEEDVIIGRLGSSSTSIVVPLLQTKTEDV